MDVRIGFGGIVGRRDVYPSSVALLLAPYEYVGGILPSCRLDTALLLAQGLGSSAVFRLLCRSAGRRLGRLLGLVVGFPRVLPSLRVLLS